MLEHLADAAGEATSVASGWAVGSAVLAVNGIWSTSRMSARTTFGWLAEFEEHVTVSALVAASQT